MPVTAAGRDRGRNGPSDVAEQAEADLGGRLADHGAEDVRDTVAGRHEAEDDQEDEEVEAVTEALRNKPIITGFYSYGEISPLNPHGRCELHNQTMTNTTLDEI